MRPTSVLTVTRFTDKTFTENLEYRRSKQHDGCIYGVPVKISPNITDNATLLVVEMNLTAKCISGIGVIQNKLDRNITCHIYDNKRYNKYIYYSKYRIDANDMDETELSFLSLVSDKLFKTKAHVQRGNGITRIPLQNVNAIQFQEQTASNYDHIVTKVTNMFETRSINLS